MATLAQQLGPFNEDGSAEYFARVEGAGAAAITQGTVSTITAYAKPRNGGTLWTAELTVEDVVYDTLQTGNGWTTDSIGYNVRYMFPPATFPTGGVDTDVQLKFVMDSGDVLWAKCKGQVEPTLGD